MKKYLILLVFILLLTVNSKGQIINDTNGISKKNQNLYLIDIDNNDVENRLEKLEIDNRILNHYSLKDINSIRLVDNEKYKQISYYYLNSYTHSDIDCLDCEFKKFIEDFDVSKYEHLRHKIDYVTLNYLKTEYTVTLIPFSELKYLTPIQQYNLTR